MGRPLVIVCGYGCDPQGWMIQKYLDFSAKVASRAKNAIIIVTGGFTSPRQFPGISEAGMMKKELIRRGINPGGILLEEMALTTNQNLEFCRQIIDSLKEKPSVVYIVCDSIRGFKIRIIARKYFGDYSFRILGFNFKRSLREKLRQIPAAIKDILSLWFPFIERIAIKLRKRAWGIK